MMNDRGATADTGVKYRWNTVYLLGRTPARPSNLQAHRREDLYLGAKTPVKDWTIIILWGERREPFALLALKLTYY